MGIFDTLFGRKNPIDKMKIDELREMEIRLNHKIEALSDVIRSLENKITNLFEDAKKTTSKNEELSIARRIKTVSQEKEMKYAAMAQLEKELRVVSNLLIIKEHEQDLRTAGVWDKVRGVDPDTLEKWLIAKKLDGQKRDEFVKTVIDITGSTLEPEVEEDDLDDIMDAIHAMKSDKSVSIDENIPVSHKIHTKETDKE